MIEKIIENVINQMIPHLEQGQLEHLSNVLYVNFHGKEIHEQCTDLAATGVDGDELKIRMFIASKKAVNRQDETLKQYAREIYNMLDFLGKRIEDITILLSGWVKNRKVFAGRQQVWYTGFGKQPCCRVAGLYST